jgi:hypothetical protein
LRDLVQKLGRRLVGYALSRAVERRFDAFFASEDFKATMAGIIKAATADGAQAERSRMAEIMGLPRAAAFPRLAWALASSNGVTMARAIEFLAHTEFDVPQSRPQPVAPSPPAADAPPAAPPTIH